ncbi:MAG TPA: hypothetical protein VFJ90_04515 [Candidatus Didemnitutus sp.]|nr:hypothetical protein [Candidatus Didemnitutus sp.]
MTVLYFIAAYLLAWVPALALCLAIGTLICAVRLLFICFVRPRATIPCFENAITSPVLFAATWWSLRGIYWLGEQVHFNPTFAIILMFLWSSLQNYRLLKPLLVEADLESRGRRFNWVKAEAELDRELDIPGEKTRLKEELKTTAGRWRERLGLAPRDPK